MSKIKRYLDNKGLTTLVDTLKKYFGRVKTVDGESPDENGNVQLSWIGTKTEWEALDKSQFAGKGIVKVYFTDVAAHELVDEVKIGNMGAVTSNAVAKAIEGPNTGAKDGSQFSDMNSITNEGTFYFRAVQIINAPADSYEAEGKLDATLEVVKLSKTPEAYIQTLRVAKNGKMFVYTRRIYDGNWSNWEELAKTTGLKWYSVTDIPPSKTWKEAAAILQHYFPEITDWTSTARDFIFKTPLRMTTNNNMILEVVGFTIHLDTDDTDSGFAYTYDTYLDYNWYGDDDAVSSWFKDCPGITGRIAYCPDGIAKYIN